MNELKPVNMKKYSELGLKYWFPLVKEKIPYVYYWCKYPTDWKPSFEYF